MTRAGMLMRRFAQTSWSTVGFFAVVWSFVWFAGMGVSFAGSADAATGDGPIGEMAAVGFGLTAAGALIVFIPPIILLTLRALLPWLFARQSPSPDRP